MSKTLQTILLTLVVSIGVGARLSILGWLFAIGVGSALIFGISHFIIHFYSMNNLAQGGKKILLNIVLSHLFFLGIFFFQFDFDDSKTYSIIGYVFGIENDLLNTLGIPIFVISIIGYIIVGIIIVRGVKRNRIKGKNIRYLIPAIIASIVLPFLFINALYSNEHLQGIKEHEAVGEFSSISHALKNPTEVEIIRIHPYDNELSHFPSEILILPNVKIIDLSEQNISVIPDEISTLKSLEDLNLLDNNIKEIPASICECKNLKELRIGGHIENLPDCLKRMKNLKHLSIQSNTANELMIELKDFTYLESSHFYLKDGVLDREKLSKIREETGIKHKY